MRAARGVARQGRRREGGLAQGVEADVVAVHDCLRVAFGAASPTLADFGMTPRRNTDARTIAEKGDAIEKSLATRKARHTMGKKQKKALRGR